MKAVKIRSAYMKIFPLATLTCKILSDFRKKKREKHALNPALQCISLCASYDAHQFLHFSFFPLFYSPNLYSNQELKIKLNHIYMST